MEKQKPPSVKNKINFEVLFESLPGLFLILLPDLTIAAASELFLNATGIIRNAIVGKQLFEVFPENPDDNSVNGIFFLRESLNHVLKMKAEHTMLLQKRTVFNKDGSFDIKYWQPVNKPVLNNNGEIIYIIHSIKDIIKDIDFQKEPLSALNVKKNLNGQAHKLEFEIINRVKKIHQINEELKQMGFETARQLEIVKKDISDYQHALEVSCIVSVIDTNGIIQYVNDNFCKVSKYEKEELLGKDIRILDSGFHTKAYISELWKAIKSKNIWKGELKNMTKEGTYYWVYTSIVPFLDMKGKPFKYLAISTDITERKLSEETIFKLNKELEKKVEERTKELNHLLENERGLNDMKSRFVTLASHEFRTPLSAILSSISLVESYNTQENEEKRNKHIARIKSSVRNLTEILDDFLSLEKLEHGKVENTVSSFDLKKYLEDIVEEMEGLLKKKNQTIHYSHTGNTNVIQDKKIIRNVVLNLLSNAIKYSPDEMEIKLVSTIDNGFASIEVKDKGIGIPKEDQKHLFNRFFRAHNAGEIQGTGLGLNIVKKYVELLNGSINFVSHENKGTTFTLNFPKEAIGKT